MWPDVMRGERESFILRRDAGYSVDWFIPPPPSRRHDAARRGLRRCRRSVTPARRSLRREWRSPFLPSAMRSLLRLALLTVVLVASAPEADAQLGGLVDRARRAVTGQGGESAPRPSDGPAPAFDFGTLLDTQFWPEQGSFHFGSPADYFLLFPPSDYDQYETDGRYVVRNEAGRVVGTSEMRGAGPTGTSPGRALLNTGCTVLFHHVWL